DETILIVEDEESILSAAQRILANRGYDVLTAETVHVALRLAADHPKPIHLLLTDVIMPDMNGRDLRTAIDRMRPGIKTLYMSGYSADVIGVEGELDAMTFFVQKPFTTDQLAQKVREALDS